MAFFKKLKDKLFKSSSKLEQGLDAIVEDGGEDDVSSREPSRSPAVGHLLAAALYDANAGGLSGMVPKGYLGWKHDSVNNWRHCS